MAIRKRYGSTARRSKYFKCRSCYSANRFCTHSSGKRGSTGRSKGSTYRRRGSTSKSKAYERKGAAKKAEEPTKIDVPVLDAAGNAAPDMIPLNGVRVRCTRLTDTQPVQYESKKFDGKVCWRGVTDAFNYEMNGEGPFLHRRILFQGPISLRFDDVHLVKLGAPSSSWSRGPAVSLDSGVMAGELRKMFGAGATIRDLLFSPVKAHGFNIVADSRKQLEGKASGARRYQKYWKGFGKAGNGIVVKYEMSSNGQYDGSLVDEEKYHHIYAMDVFQYGINGLDAKIPGSAVVGEKRGGDGELGGGSTKRSKSGGSSKSDDSYVDSMDGLELRDSRVAESAVHGVVRVLSNMKLYWYDPK